MSDAEVSQVDGVVGIRVGDGFDDGVGDGGDGLGSESEDPEPT